MSITTQLDQRITALQSKLDKLISLRNALDDEDVAQELQQAFGSEQAPAARGKKTKRVKYGTAFDKIKQFFVDRSNAWATLKEIVASTGVPIGTARQQIYRTNIDAFIREKEDGFGQETKFKLSNKK